MAETATEETTETETTTGQETTTDIPQWLQDPKYGEILKDESARNILRQYKNETEAIKAAAEHKKMLSSGFRIPKKLSAEQTAELRTHMDRVNEVPEKPEGYDMVRPQEIPEGLDLSEQFKMEIRAYAKEQGLGKAAVQGFYEKSLQAMKRAAENAETVKAEHHETARKGAVALMQNYWGPQEYMRVAGDPDNKRVGLIDQYMRSRAIDQAEFDDLAGLLEETGLRNHPLLFKVVGDAARFWHILEGQASVTTGQFQQTDGNRKLSNEAKMARMFPNTPKSHGGGAAG